MTTIRRFCCNYLLRLTSFNLDYLTKTEEDGVWSPADRFYSPGELSRIHIKLSFSLWTSMRLDCGIFVTYYMETFEG
ncbi:hypothetical protein ABKV19_018179 [Rosa sericea]